MRKISINVRTDLDCALAGLFDNVPISDFVWCELGWTEFYSIINEKYVDFFTEEIMSGIDFKTKILKPVYPIMVHIGAFYSTSDIVPIKTTTDYISSNCELLLVVTDSTFVDVYVRNDEYAITIAQNARNIDSEAASVAIKNDNSQIVY